MMSDVSIEQDLIERDLAQTRARMDRRLTDLEQRLSPGQVLDDLMTYFRGSEGAEFGRNLMASVQDNPMPAALTGIGLAWLMASSTHIRSNGAATQPRAAAEAPRERHEDLELRVLSAGGAIYRLPDESEEDHRTRIDDARGSALGLKRQAEENAESFATRISDALADAKQAATETLHDLRDSATETIDRLKESTGTAGQGAAAIRHATTGLISTLTGNPVALGAMGLMVGAVLGALVPQSEAEEAALGGIAGQARKAATDLAQQAADKGGQIAQTLVDAGLESARGQGLTGDKPMAEFLKDARSGDLADAVKEVAQDVIGAGGQALRDAGPEGEGKDKNDPTEGGGGQGNRTEGDAGAQRAGERTPLTSG
ncbi:MAG TPA: DUF3618 domain-containing protein [Alphaproteobacteria bacterium]|nr:DUF3618 domain-containing protein [Alphaproteobacteria bacterium]